MGRKKSSSSRQWLREHFDDPYVKRAQAEGHRSRAIYKLQEIDERDQLFRAGMAVVDLGAAPGGWSEYVRTRVGAQGKVIALDILPMEPIPGVEFIQGDFMGQAALDELRARVGDRPVDIVISDMAPNISGISVSDQAKATYLAELALDFAAHSLKPGGQCLIKAFQGAGFNELFRAMQARFVQVISRKPKASRPRSPEVYLLGKGFKG